MRFHNCQQERDVKIAELADVLDFLYELTAKCMKNWDKRKPDHMHIMERKISHSCWVTLDQKMHVTVKAQTGLLSSKIQLSFDILGGIVKPDVSMKVRVPFCSERSYWITINRKYEDIPIEQNFLVEALLLFLEKKGVKIKKTDFNFSYEI